MHAFIISRANVRDPFSLYFSHTQKKQNRVEISFYRVENQCTIRIINVKDTHTYRHTDTLNFMEIYTIFLHLNVGDLKNFMHDDEKILYNRTLTLCMHAYSHYFSYSIT